MPALNLSDGDGLVIIISAYLALVSAVWLMLAVGIDPFLARWGMTRLQGDPTALQESTLCIPVRDEALLVERAITTALAEGVGEVIVVDDGSTDGTLAKARALSEPRLRVIQGTSPPAGWSGKAWACQRAAGEAKGSLLIFMDADVDLTPGLIGRLLAHRRGEALLSAWPSWGPGWECWAGWLVLGALDLGGVADLRNPLALASGALMAVDAQHYHAVGGHGVAPGELWSERALATAIKGRGGRIALLVGNGAMRLTRGGWTGLQRRLYEHLGRRPIRLLGIALFIAITGLFPSAILIGLWIANRLWGWWLPFWPFGAWLVAIIGLIGLTGVRLRRADGIPWPHAVASGLVLPMILAPLTLALFATLWGVEVVWKGRRFIDGRLADHHPPPSRQR